MAKAISFRLPPPPVTTFGPFSCHWFRKRNGQKSRSRGGGTPPNTAGAGHRREGGSRGRPAPGAREPRTVETRRGQPDPREELRVSLSLARARAMAEGTPTSAPSVAERRGGTPSRKVSLAGRSPFQESETPRSLTYPNTLLTAARPDFLNVIDGSVQDCHGRPESFCQPAGTSKGPAQAGGRYKSVPEASKDGNDEDDVEDPCCGGGVSCPRKVKEIQVRRTRHRSRLSRPSSDPPPPPRTRPPAGPASEDLGRCRADPPPSPPPHPEAKLLPPLDATKRSNN